MLPDACAEPVERRTQADTLHRGRVELIAEVADLLHDGFEQRLYLLDVLARGAGAAVQVHADQVELESQSGEVLAHHVVQKLGGLGALRLLRLERARHRAAQLVIGPGEVGNFPHHAAGVRCVGSQAESTVSGWQTGFSRWSTTVQPPTETSLRSRRAVAHFERDLDIRIDDSTWRRFCP